MLQTLRHYALGLETNDAFYVLDLAARQYGITSECSYHLEKLAMVPNIADPLATKVNVYPFLVFSYGYVFCMTRVCPPTIASVVTEMDESMEDTIILIEDLCRDICKSHKITCMI